MKQHTTLFLLAFLISSSAYAEGPESRVVGSSPDTSAATPEKTTMVDGVLTGLTARASRGIGPFDGEVDKLSDLDDLVETAWGDGGLGLHRGHAPILGILEAFLGINHSKMHDYMENDALNLAGTCTALGLEADKLVQSLTNSFEPYIDQGVSNGLITEAGKQDWLDKVRDAFKRRVYWEG